jgi:hypothetical protein
MDINQKTAKIPFWVLYGLAAGISVFDLIFTYVFLSSNSAAHEGNPVHAYFASIIGLRYFLFLIPISLLAFYGIIKFAGWAIRRLDKRTEINGENFMAVIIILLTFPNVLINEIFTVLFGKQVLRLGFDPALMLAVVLTLVYITLADVTDRKAKKKKKDNATLCKDITKTYSARAMCDIGCFDYSIFAFSMIRFSYSACVKMPFPLAAQQG